MKVNVDSDLAKFVDAEVRAGRFSSAQEVVNAALARLQTDRQLGSAQEIARLRGELDPAIAQADAKEFVEFTAQDVIAEARAIRARRRKGA